MELVWAFKGQKNIIGGVVGGESGSLGQFGTEKVRILNLKKSKLKKFDKHTLIIKITKIIVMKLIKLTFCCSTDMIAASE